MPNPSQPQKPLNIGFISFRFAGTDGVSLETTKWAQVLEEQGHTCYYFAGLCDRPADRSMLVPEAHFLHPKTREMYDHFFGAEIRTSQQTDWIHAQAHTFRQHLRKFIKKFKLDVLIPQNILSFPLNIALSLGLTELIAESGIATIAHHHDFGWERKDLQVSSIQDFINMAVPPNLPSIQHVVINSAAQQQLSLRLGVSAEIIPNVMDYENPPSESDDYSDDLRQRVGLADDELFILQPTRVVQRKGIEHAIELVSRLGMKASLVISHASGDDGYEYEARIMEYAKLMNVRIILTADIFGERRGIDEQGHKIYSLWDAYRQADLVTYPSLIEGFGNAFLEAIYFKKPIVINNYAIYAADIRPKGFKVIEFDEYITEETVEQTRAILTNNQLVAEYGQYNYDLALRYYSYRELRNKLNVLLNRAFETNSYK